MKKLFKKNAPTKATYFKSESQRKRTSRLSFIYGSKRLVAVITVLVLASGVAGFAILQKTKDSKAAVRNDAWSLDATAAQPTAMYTPQWSVQGGGAASAQVTPHPLLLTYPAGQPRTAGQKTCWAYAIPGDVTATEIGFDLVANSAGSTFVTVEYWDGVSPAVQTIAGPLNTAINGIHRGIVPTPHPGGFARMCLEMTAGAPANSKLLEQRSVYANGFSFKGSKAVQVADAPDIEVIGTIKDSSGKGVAGAQISNCQIFPAATSDVNGQYRFTVKQGTGYCVRIQGGIDTSLTIRATNTNRGATATSASYEGQVANSRATAVDFLIKTPVVSAPVTGCPSLAKAANTVQRVDAPNLDVISTITPKPTQLANETTADGCTAVVLFRNNQSVEYTFTTPNEKGKYNILVRAASKVAAKAKAQVVISYPSDNLSAATSNPFEFDKDFSNTALINGAIPELSPNSKINVTITFTGDGGSGATDINLWVDYLELRKADGSAVTTPATGSTPGTATTTTPASDHNANCESGNTKGTGLEVPATATEGVKVGAVNVTDTNGKKVVKLKKNGDYVECVIKLPASAEAGGYVLAYNGRGGLGTGETNFGDYSGTNVTLAMNGGNGGKQTFEKLLTADIGNLSYSDGRMAVDRDGADKTVRFLQPGEKVLARVTLNNPANRKGEFFLDNLQLFKDPCTGADGKVLDGVQITAEITCAKPASASTPSGSGTPAPSASGASATTPTASGKCTNDATSERTVEAEKSSCAPNVNKVVTDVDGIQAVQLRNDGDFVEYNFKNNKSPGKYRAQSIVRKTEPGSYVEYKFTKVTSNPLTSKTTAEARNVGITYSTSTMTQPDKYIDLTQDEINANITLKIRVTYRRTPGTNSDVLSKINVDKLILDRVGDVTPLPPSPVAVPRPSSPTGSSATGTSQSSGTTTTGSSGAGTSQGSTNNVGSDGGVVSNLRRGAQRTVEFLQYLANRAKQLQIQQQQAKMKACGIEANNYAQGATRGSSNPNYSAISLATKAIYDACMQR